MFSYNMFYDYDVVLVFTELFVSSGIFLDFVMAEEFFWHSQHRSVIGFMTRMRGASSRQ